MDIQYTTREDLVDVIQNEAKINVNGIVESALEEAEQTHCGVKREDDSSPFLETHLYPVTVDVIRHYRSANKFLTTLQVASSLLHDIMEDDERILDPSFSKSYGFDAYFRHRFGEYVYDVATTLKVKPLDNYSEFDEKAQGAERFKDYCAKLLKADYDAQVIKMADRINNMEFIATIPGHEKINRYLREAEDFYLSFAHNTPGLDDFYEKMRKAYDELKKQGAKNEQQVLHSQTVSEL